MHRLGVTRASDPRLLAVVGFRAALIFLRMNPQRDGQLRSANLITLACFLKNVSRTSSVSSTNFVGDVQSHLREYDNMMVR